jgi:hypothetical protein
VTQEDYRKRLATDAQYTIRITVYLRYCPPFRQCYVWNDRLGDPTMARAQPHEPETPMTRDEFLAWVAQRQMTKLSRRFSFPAKSDSTRRGSRQRSKSSTSTD